MVLLSEWLGLLNESMVSLNELDNSVALLCQSIVCDTGIEACFVYKAQTWSGASCFFASQCLRTCWGICARFRTKRMLTCAGYWLLESWIAKLLRLGGGG